MTTFAPHRRAVSLGLAALLAACGRENPTAPAAETTPVAPAVLPPEPPPAPARDAAALKSLLDAQIAARGLPALAAAYVTSKGLAFSAASGARRFGEDDRVAADDVWHIGSNTKAMTAALYARLVDAGRATWGATLPALFPDLALDPAWMNVTIEDLLSHRAGLADVDPAWLIARRADRATLPEQRLACTKEWLAAAPPQTVGAFAYANSGYVMAAAAIEAVTKTSWEEAIERHVFSPLGMTNRGFGPPPGDAPQGHKGTEPFRFRPAGLGPDADNPPVLAPAGGVHVTLDDWAKFIAIFLDPDQIFLTPEAIAHLTTPSPGGEYALGWGVADRKGERLLAHDGSNTMWLTRAVASSAGGYAMLIAINCAGPPADAALDAVSLALSPA